MKSVGEQNELVKAAAFEAYKFEIGRSDPRLTECLKEFPPSVFSERLYQSIELMERYSIELAVDLLGRLNVGEHLGEWRSADELCELLGFQARFKLPLEWILTRLVETGFVKVRENGTSRSYRLGNMPWQPDLQSLRAFGVNIDPSNAATLDLLDHAANLYPAVATDRQSGDQHLFGPQGIPLWLNYFHNDNLTYAVNNWVGAVVAADHLSSRRKLRILELGAGTGSGTEILLKLLDERGLLQRLERYLVTEPNAYFRRCNQRKLAAQYSNAPLEWATLDLDLPWNTQGITTEGFDLVYAVNVMHISKDLLFSLNEARSALTTGGWLVIAECVRPFADQPIYPELMFQILESFTNVETDPEIRPNPGFLTAEQWRRAFSRAGFAYSDVTPDIDRIRAFYPHFFTGAICGRNTTTK
ncbi:MAG: class I SAM-dependent methyltransferase [Alphaproteobacteria bacterium]